MLVVLCLVVGLMVRFPRPATGSADASRALGIRKGSLLPAGWRRLPTKKLLDEGDKRALRPALAAIEDWPVLGPRHGRVRGWAAARLCARLAGADVRYALHLHARQDHLHRRTADGLREAHLQSWGPRTARTGRGRRSPAVAAAKPPAGEQGQLDARRWRTVAGARQASAGDRFDGALTSTGPFDLERYQEIASIAEAMLAELADVPVARIAGLVGEHATRLRDAEVDVRGALIEDRRSTARPRAQRWPEWTLPGGFRRCRRSASENIVKEMREESKDRRRRHGSLRRPPQGQASLQPDVRATSTSCSSRAERQGEAAFAASEEIVDVGCFAPVQPPLSTGGGGGG